MSKRLKICNLEDIKTAADDMLNESTAKGEPQLDIFGAFHKTSDDDESMLRCYVEKSWKHFSFDEYLEHAG